MVSRILPFEWPLIDAVYQTFWSLCRNGRRHLTLSTIELYRPSNSIESQASLPNSIQTPSNSIKPSKPLPVQGMQGMHTYKQSKLAKFNLLRCRVRERTIAVAIYCRRIWRFRSSDFKLLIPNFFKVGSASVVCGRARRNIQINWIRVIRN